MLPTIMHPPPPPTHTSIVIINTPKHHFSQFDYSHEELKKLINMLVT